jgi:hypothetical protein
MKKIVQFTLLLMSMLSIRNANAQNYNWAAQFSATSFNSGYSYIRNSVTDKAGNIYVSGAYFASVWFAGTTLSGSGSSTFGFVLKLNRNGNLSWVKNLPGNNIWNGLGSDVTAIALDNNGNLYLTGNFSGTVDFDPSAGTNNITSAGDKDIFVAKWDTSGNAIWTKTMGSTTEDVAEAICVTADGSSIFTTGSFTGTVDFDPSGATSNLTAAAAQDGYIHCLDGAGNFVWSKGILGSGNQKGLGICLNSTEDHIYVSGTLEGTTAFATLGALNISSNGGSDGFIGKYNAATGGNPLWVKRIGGLENDELRAVKQDRKSDNIYIGGTFRVTVDFDPGVGVDEATSVGVTYGPTNPHTDAFVVKLDNDGNYIWKSIHANAAFLSLAEIDVDKNGFVYSVGSFTGNATTSQGVTNIFATSQGWVVKLDSNGTNVWSASYGQQQWSDESTTICVSDSLDVNVGGDYNRGAPNGYAMGVDFAGGSITTSNGYVSAISQHSQKRPTLVNMYAANVTWNTAGLYYTWNPEGKATTLLVEYGTTISLGSSLPTVALGSGTSNVFNVEFLNTTGNTKYYYRMTATNVHGSTVSWIDSFTTPQGPIPVVTVLDPNIFGPNVVNITNNSATITNIDVAANNLSTNVFIEYGFTTTYGNTVATTPATLTGNTPTSISALLSGLTPGLYHFRVKATNAAGSAYSTDQTFIISAPLPLSWKSFTAHDNQKVVLLTWETADEQHCAYFEIQSSKDGLTWKPEAKITAKNNAVNTYQYEDYTNYFGIRYYRIKQVDIDGRFTFSTIEKLNRKQADLFSVYPNPSNGNVNIATTGLAHVELYTLDGKKVYSKQISPADNSLMITSLAKGNYLLKITTSENEVFTTHIVRQ